MYARKLYFVNRVMRENLQPEAQRAQGLARPLLAEQRTKALNRRALPAAPRNHKAVVFVLGGDEAEPVLAGRGIEGCSPSRSMLRDRRRHGVVRFGLQPVGGRRGAGEQPVEQNAGAAAGVAVDHQTIGGGEGGGDCLFECRALKARIAASIDNPLPPTVT